MSNDARICVYLKIVSSCVRLVAKEMNFFPAVSFDMLETVRFVPP